MRGAREASSELLRAVTSLYPRGSQNFSDLVIRQLFKFPQQNDLPEIRGQLLDGPSYPFSLQLLTYVS